MDHSIEAIRIDCLELACVNPKLSEPPGKLELEVSPRGDFYHWIAVRPGVYWSVSCGDLRFLEMVFLLFRFCDRNIAYVLCTIADFQISPYCSTMQLVSHWLSLSLRNTSVGQRNKVIAVLTKLMQRIKVAVGAILHRATLGTAGGSQRQRKNKTVSGLLDEGGATSSKPASGEAIEPRMLLPHIHTISLNAFCYPVILRGGLSEM